MDKFQLQKLLDLAVEAATKAAKFIQDFPREKVKISSKLGAASIASEVVTQVDVMAQDIILEVLKPSTITHDLGILTEELEDDLSRKTKDYFWCIDPIDGTLAFTRGTTGYSVSIALISQQGEPIIGVVCNPTTEDVYAGAKGLGVKKNNLDWVRTTQKSPSYICDPTFVQSKKYDATIAEFKKYSLSKGYKDISIMNIGGAVMNAIWTIEKAPAIYTKPPKEKKGGGSLWDYAATTCIFTELGLEVSDYNGNPLIFNNEETIYFNHCGVRFSTLEK